MATRRYALNTNYSDGTTLYTGAEIARVHRILDSQLGGALEALGTGIIADPDAGSLKATFTAPDTITIAPGRALVRHSQHGGCLLEIDDTLTLNGVPIDEPIYIFVALDIDAENDSRESAAPIILVQDSDSCDGGELLATLDLERETPLVDERRFFSIHDLLAKVAQLQSDVGYDEAERAKGSLADRLNALLGEEGEAAVITYLTQLKWSEADARAADAAIEAKLAALAAEFDAKLAEGGAIPQQPLIDFYAHRQAQLILIARGLDTQSVESLEGAYIRRNVGGDGTADTENHVGPGTTTPTDRGWVP